VLHKNNPTYSFFFEGFSFKSVETRNVIAVSNPVHLFDDPVYKDVRKATY